MQKNPKKQTNKKTKTKQNDPPKFHGNFWKQSLIKSFTVYCRMQRDLSKPKDKCGHNIQKLPVYSSECGFL